MAEKNIVNAIMRYLKPVPECFCWKEHGGMYGTAGLPDIICCINGRFVAFEVKTESGRLTKLQETTMQKIKAAKGEALGGANAESNIMSLCTSCHSAITAREGGRWKRRRKSC